VDEGELLDVMGTTEEFLLKNGYLPSGGAKSPSTEKSSAVEKCPKCGSPLINITAKGRPAIKCSTAEWDPVTKVASGCDYFKYLDSNGDEGATPKQMEILKDKGLWKEGMSKTKASEVISAVLGK
jgi:hypothetical protein